ncbi:DNA replication protein DnaD [Virgibacillus indicus]|uniref:DNA replication protein DnaD n=1 Tax=Virgibacillus indicus TaxID=2024554 RepID=A0A265NDL5_9BACI|nr:DnaD domain-containing protein [Virgibacillus indicus]OZU90140.1 DNA replication protein DnaD [Virgibacillus indicus]
MTNTFPIQEILLNQVQIPNKLLASYTALGLNEIELAVILQLHRFLHDKNDFPTPSEIAGHLTIDEKECANILRSLIQKNVLEIEQNENDQQRRSEAYCLNPLWEKLFTKENHEEEQSDGTIFILFEQEFGRPLSPFEIETINAWLDEDKIAPELIKAGLRESVLMGKLNFKYIDRILRDWRKKGIHSVEQARNSSRNFHNNQVLKKENPQKRDTSFYYNWLEGED